MFSETTLLNKSLLKGGGSHSQSFLKSLIQSKNKKLQVTLNKDCLACSGQSSIILKAFKLACLSYHSQPIVYKSTTYEREDLIRLNGNMVNSVWQKLKTQHPWRLQSDLNASTEAYDCREGQNSSVLFSNQLLQQKYQD